MLQDAKREGNYGFIEACFRKRLGEFQLEIGSCKGSRAFCMAPANMVGEYWRYSKCRLHNP